jgi:PleD family two-component response regulator
MHDLLKQELGRFSVEGTVVSASMGVTTMRSEDRSYQDTLKRADLVLYEAKSRGKGRIVAA